MNGMTVDAAIEHLSSILNQYLTSDLDSFSQETIAFTISSLETFDDQYHGEDDLSILLGLITQIISNLYVARGYATPDIPRDLLYYERMGSVRRLIRQLKSLS